MSPAATFPKKMLLYFLVTIPLFIFALVIHEYAHGWVANKLGDPTAKYSGRLTFNPIAHIDLVGTIILPVFLLLARSPIGFGWAKPVPVNFSFLKNPKADMFWVGLAGPAANILAALAFAVILRIPLISGILFVKIVLSHIVMMNVVLGVFNMIPIPPLDGSRVLYSVLPDRVACLYIRFEPFGMFILLALLWLGVIDKIIWPAALSLIKIMGV